MVSSNSLFCGSKWPDIAVYSQKSYKEMLGATVFIFLFEQLPGFQEALNSTLQSLHKNGDRAFKSSFVQRCDPVVAKSLLNNMKYDIKREIYNDRQEISKNYFQRSNEVYAYEELSPETSYNIGTVYENSIEDSNNLNSLEATNDVYENNNNPRTSKEDKSEFDNDNIINSFNETNTEKLNDEIEFHENVPFLVAIFETLSNVTAQTCGGTLLSPNWVLTAASCVDLLSYLYSNGSRTKLNTANVSAYTVVTGSANPFADGTTHTVTNLTLLPNELGMAKLSNISDGNWTNSKREIQDTTPTLALMRIEPAASVGILQICRNQSIGADDFQVYGWILTNNETGHEVMNATTFRAKIMRSEECRVHHNSILCLTPRNSGVDKAKQEIRKRNEEVVRLKMNSGGPVVMMRNGELSVIGVAQLGRSFPLLAYPLSAYVPSIDKILHSK